MPETRRGTIAWDSSAVLPALGLGVALALAAYLARLDSLNIPSIGDEPLYLQITRVTAASGHWLPLRAQGGINNTKPPLLFWQGIVATGWGQHWSLWRLRLPIVVYSLLTAAAAGGLAARLSGRLGPGLLAGLIYLGAFSTFQQGRPVLTNAPETFFLFAPLVLFLLRGGLTWRLAAAAGVLAGLAALYKSFFLVVPLTVAFSLILWSREGTLPFLRRAVPRLGAMALLGLGLFALWFAADPRPDLVLRSFILGENASKLQLSGYLAGLFRGTYPLTRIWLGDFLNLGFYAFTLAGLLWLTLRRRRQAESDGGLSRAEKDLWLFVLAFLLVYSVPSQRQENYILPTVPALSVLLALRWNEIASGWHRLTLGAAGLGLVLALWAMVGIGRAVPDAGYAAGDYALVGVLLLLAMFGLSSAARTRLLAPVVVCGMLLTIGAALVPFDRPFRPVPGGPGLGALAGRSVHVPSNFAAREERFRFLLPRSGIQPYDSRTPGTGEALLEQGRTVALLLPPDGAPAPDATVFGEKYEIRTRRPSREIRRIIFGGEWDLLAARVVIVRRGNRDGE